MADESGLDDLRQFHLRHGERRRRDDDNGTSGGGDDDNGIPAGGPAWGRRPTSRGTSVNGNTYDSYSDIDFDSGDQLKFINYDAGTFREVSGDNDVWNNRAGTYVAVDSVLDIADMAAGSADVSASTSGGALVVRIAQDSGTHFVTLNGLASEWGEANDPDLF